MIFCSIKLSDMKINSIYVMYSIEIHKVLKNVPKDKNYTTIGKRKTRRIQIYPQK